MSSPPLFIIAGPTAVGKSELAVLVAEHCGGEIISADAFQIYEGFDILTAKPDSSLRRRIPHHLIGEIPPTQVFDAAQYINLAKQRIADIRQRGRIPMVAGGAGFYLNALIHGLPKLPSADAQLRAELDPRSTPELLRQLAELDPECHARIDRNNRRRLIRALEVCLLTGRPFSSFRDQESESAIPFTGVVLNRDRQDLHERIDRRTESMFAAGVVEEVSAAGSIGATAAETLGWKEIRALIDGRISREECIASVQQLTRQYAKRQLTWFRRQFTGEWIELTGDVPPPCLIENLAQKAETQR